MAQIHAQHTTVGKYHLETYFNSTENMWEWWARTIKPHDGPEFHGRARELAGAKKGAAASIGVVLEIQWTPIGPLVEVPDDQC